MCSSDLGVDKKCLQEFWEWRIAQSSDIEELKEFGFWIDRHQQETFDAKWWTTQILRTLEKTKGVLSWEYGLTQSLQKFAEQCPENTTKILDLILNKSPQQEYLWAFDKNILPVLKFLSENPKTKSEIEKIADKLILRGLWKAKEIFQK